MPQSSSHGTDGRQAHIEEQIASWMRIAHKWHQLIILGEATVIPDPDLHTTEVVLEPFEAWPEVTYLPPQRGKLQRVMISQCGVLLINGFDGRGRNLSLRTNLFECNAEGVAAVSVDPARISLVTRPVLDGPPPRLFADHSTCRT